MTFLFVTHVMYERSGKTLLLQNIHVIRAEDKDEATTHIEAWLDQSYPEPAYFGHEYDAHDMPGVTMDDEHAALEFAVSETPITVSPPIEKT